MLYSTKAHLSARPGPELGCLGDTIKIDPEVTLTPAQRQNPVSCLHAAWIRTEMVSIVAYHFPIGGPTSPVPETLFRHAAHVLRAFR